MGVFQFSKLERLSQQKHIQDLFDKGSSFYSFPFKVFLRPHPFTDFASHQILLSVSSRNFKRAVDRNLIKRRIREAYRAQKHKLSQSPKLQLALLYTAKEILSLQEIKSKMPIALAKIEKAGKTYVSPMAQHE